MCACSLTVRSVQGVLLRVAQFSVFPRPPHPLLLSLLLLLSLYLHWTLCSVWRVLGLGLGVAGGASGWVAGRARFWGVLATWVTGQHFQPPRFSGTQPPCATQALIIQGQWILTLKKELIHLITNNVTFCNVMSCYVCWAWTMNNSSVSADLVSVL